MTVKIQRSLFTNEGCVQMYIYDKSRRHEYQGPITDPILDLMGEKPKIYAKAKLIDDGNGGQLFEILKIVKPRNW